MQRITSAASTIGKKPTIAISERKMRKSTYVLRSSAKLTLGDA